MNNNTDQRPVIAEAGCGAPALVSKLPVELNLMLDSHNIPAILTSEAMSNWCLNTLAMQQQLDLLEVSQIELSVEFVDAQTMQELNKQYREKDSPTNVLSFESDLPAISLTEDTEGNKMQILGDLVFCEDVILKEASDQNKTAEQHWIHLFVHGTLHLCGYDHIHSEDAKAMESLEIQILSALGIPDPYNITEYQ